MILGRHPCLWCTVIAIKMQLPKDQRGPVTVRTLQHLAEMLTAFEAAGGHLKKAKEFNNVIHAPLFNIPIDQVNMWFLAKNVYNFSHKIKDLCLVYFYPSQICIPGLHISLGLFLKFYVLYENECSEMDERIVAKLAESEADPDDVNIDSHLQTLREAHKHETQAKEYLEQVTATQEYVTYLVATSRLDMDAAQAHPVVLQLLEAIQLLQQKAQQEVKCTNLPPHNLQLHLLKHNV